MKLFDSGHLVLKRGNMIKHRYSEDEEVIAEVDKVEGFVICRSGKKIDAKTLAVSWVKW